MKRFLLVSLFLVAGFLLRAQTAIKLEEISQHTGDSVRVCGKVFGGRYFDNAANTPTLLNVGAAYPNQLLTVVMYGELRTKFEGGKPEEFFLGKEVCVTGKIELYKDKPQIVIRDAGQLVLKKD